MKQILLTTIAAVLLVGCGVPSVDIWTAAFDGNIEAVKQHLAAGTDVNVKDKDGWTPLHLAAWKSHKKIVELLIDKGANVNANTTDRWSVLDMALSGTDKDIIDLIKASGGTSNADQSIFVASGIGNLEVVERHLASGLNVNAKSVNGWTLLHYAADQKKVAEFLLLKGADVNAKSDRSETPLDLAIEDNHTETANLLRKHGGKTGEELKAEGK